MQQPWSAMSKKKREYDFVAKSPKQCRVSLYGQTFCDEYAHGRPFVEMLNQGVCFVVCSTSCCADMSIKHGGINRSAHMRLIEVVFFKLLNYSETVWSSEDRHLQTKKHIARKTIEMDIKKRQQWLRRSSDPLRPQQHFFKRTLPTQKHHMFLVKHNVPLSA